MKYISVEEFRKQSEDVQQALIKWFLENKSTTDLVQVELYPKSEIKLYSLILQECNLDFKDSTLIKFKDRTITTRYEITPLLTEGQLREFIEDKIGCKMNVSYKYKPKDGHMELEFDFYEYPSKEKYMIYISTKDIIVSNMLEGWWKVACEIASNVD